MNHRSRVVVLSLIALVFVSVTPAHAQEQWTAPRSADNQPDLQGIWSHNSATPLERPKELAGKDVISNEELAELNQRIAEIRESEQAGDILGDRLIRQALDANTPRTFDPITGNYNSFWLVERELDNRTSLVVYPEDGQIPALTAGRIVVSTRPMGPRTATLVTDVYISGCRKSVPDTTATIRFCRPPPTL